MNRFLLVLVFALSPFGGLAATVELKSDAFNVLDYYLEVAALGGRDPFFNGVTQRTGVSVEFEIEGRLKRSWAYGIGPSGDEVYEEYDLHPRERTTLLPDVSAKRLVEGVYAPSSRLENGLATESFFVFLTDENAEIEASYFVLSLESAPDFFTVRGSSSGFSASSSTEGYFEYLLSRSDPRYDPDNIDNNIYDLTFSGGGPLTLQVTQPFAPVPLPASGLFLAVAALALGAVRRRDGVSGT